MAKRPDSLMIPVRALGQNQDRHFVLTIDPQGAVQYRLVRPGAQQDGMVVIEEGLSSEDTIIVDGLLKVRPGVVPETRPADIGTTGSAASGAPAGK
jgi:multidrug efflux system membrane fusion protein